MPVTWNVVRDDDEWRVSRMWRFLVIGLIGVQGLV